MPRRSPGSVSPAAPPRSRSLAPPEGVKPGWDAADALAEGWDQAPPRHRPCQQPPRPRSPQTRPAMPAPMRMRVKEFEAGAKPRRERIVDILVGLATAAGGRAVAKPIWRRLCHDPDRRPLRELADPVGAVQEMADQPASPRQRPQHAGDLRSTTLAPTSTPLPPRVRYSGRRCASLAAPTRSMSILAMTVGARSRSPRSGRTIIDRPPVKFIRSPSMLALPQPEVGGVGR